jgi:hypothetical protein
MRCRCLAAALLIQALSVAGALAAEEGEDKILIEDLMKGGWQVAGYTSTLDERSAFILFRHPSEHYLVQCRAGYDVTRSPRVFSNCYKLR